MPITSDLAARICKATEAIPPAHRRPPTKNEDWAFTQGFALAIESRNKVRLRVECVNHHKKTRNTRKTQEEDRARPNTVALAKDCPYALYISYRKKKNAWMIGFTCSVHNHPLEPDPFQFREHIHRNPGHSKALMLGGGLRHAGLSYSKARKVLRNHDVRLSVNDYYNLKRSEGKLTNKEALQLLLAQLDLEVFWVRVMEKYVVDDEGQRTARVVQHILFCSSEQIRLARRFVSGFCMQTDATFNTNKLRLPLSVIVGITNTLKTFPVAYCFITSESAEAFEFVNTNLKELMFYDCPGPAIVVGDFSKGLAAAMARHEGLAEGLSSGGPTTAMESVEGAGEGPTTTREGCILQLCEWHAVEAIKKRLVVAGQYVKERRDELVDMIWDWVKAPTVAALEERRERLLMGLKNQEREYLVAHYQPKERQFIRAYTRLYPNLGVHSTQRNESYHVVVKAVVHRQLPLPDAVRQLRDQIKELAEDLKGEIDKQRKSLPRSMDKDAFQILGPLLTHQALNILIPEWEATKESYSRVEQPLREPKPEPGCMSACELPTRWGLPCQHWMRPAMAKAVPLSLSLVHPRWLLDGPKDVPRTWVMMFVVDGVNSEEGEEGADASDTMSSEGEEEVVEEAEDDRYRDHGANMALSAAVAAIEYQKQLTGPQAEHYASALHKNVGRLTAAFDAQAKAQKTLPPELPNAIPPEENWLPAFRTAGRKRRAMTGREAAEAAERDASCARRRREIEALAVAVNNVDDDDDDEVVRWLNQPRHLQVPHFTPVSPSSAPSPAPPAPSSSSSDDDDNNDESDASNASTTRLVPSTMPKEVPSPSAPPPATATRSSGRVLRPSAKKVDAEAAVTARVRARVPATTRHKALVAIRKPRIPKARKEDVSQLLETFSQPTQDMIVVIHSSP